jgi:3-phenylpropionate/cinnamic acid dioxygenase small subunit
MMESNSESEGGSTASVAEWVDRSSVVDLLYRYATAIDGRDWRLLRTCFTDDAKLDYGQTGRWNSGAEVTEHMSKSHDDFAFTQHRITNPVVDITGDTAAARSYVHAVFVPGDAPDQPVHAYGHYDDELVRTSGGWQIAKRSFVLVHVNAVGRERAEQIRDR